MGRLVSSEILSSGISSGNLIPRDNGSEASVDSKISAGTIRYNAGEIRIGQRVPRAHSRYETCFFLTPLSLSSSLSPNSLRVRLRELYIARGPRERRRKRPKNEKVRCTGLKEDARPDRFVHLLRALCC